MVRLLKNDFFKMLKEKAHLILLVILIASSLISFGMMASISFSGIQTMTSELKESLAVSAYLSSMSGSNMGMFIVLSISIYLGNDFRNRTINLKVLAGYSRSKIYFGILLVNFIVFAIFFVFNVLLCFTFSYMFFGGFGSQLKDVLIKTALMLPPYLAIVSVAVLISLSLKSTLGIVINMVILLVIATIGQVFTLMFVLGYDNTLMKFISEVVPYFALSNIAGGNALFGLLESGEKAYPISMVLKNIIGSAVFAAGALTGGYFVFRAKPLT